MQRLFAFWADRCIISCSKANVLEGQWVKVLAEDIWPPNRGDATTRDLRTAAQISSRFRAAMCARYSG
jgi:hypothetical protein